ncbi:MAG: hypothetical protein ABL940_06030 [Bacteroidia bacterium]
MCVVLVNSLTSTAQIAKKDSVIAPSKWRFDCLIDKRKTIFLTKNTIDNSNIATSVNGINAGLTYYKKFRVGLGAYLANGYSGKSLFISKPYYVAEIQKKAPQAVPVSINGISGYLTNSSLFMFYATPSFEYIFYNSKWLTLGIPIELGIGYSKITLTDFFSNTTIPITNSNGKTFDPKNYFFPALAGLNVMVNLSPDVAFVGSAGYRKIISEIGISQNFDGVYYQIGFRLLPQNIKKQVYADFTRWLNKNRKK